MKCQILLSGKNKRNIIKLSSAELAQRVVKVKEYFFMRFFLFHFSRKNIGCGYSLEVPH